MANMWNFVASSDHLSDGGQQLLHCVKRLMLWKSQRPVGLVHSRRWGFSTMAGQTPMARKTISFMKNEHFVLRIVIPGQMSFLCVNNGMN